MKRDQFGRDLRKLCEFPSRISSEVIFELYELYCSQYEGRTVYYFLSESGNDFGIVLKSGKEVKPVSIKKFSSKRQKTESSYKKVLEEKINESWGRVRCSGCNTYSGIIDPSHIIPRSERLDLIDDPRNIRWHCRERCHELCELGRYSELDDGKNIVEYLKEVDKGFLMRKLNNSLNGEER